MQRESFLLPDVFQSEKNPTTNKKKTKKTRHKWVRNYEGNLST